MSILDEINEATPLSDCVAAYLTKTHDASGPQRAERLDALARCLERLAQVVPETRREATLAAAAAAQGGDVPQVDLVELLGEFSSQLAGLPVEVDPADLPPPIPAVPEDDRAWAASSIVSPDAIESMVNGLGRGETSKRWIDLGSGDGRSLRALAVARPTTSFVGVDLAWSFSVMGSNHRQDAIEELPGNARYIVLGPGGGPKAVRCEYIQVSPEAFRFSDELAKQTRGALGERCADVVSLLFPIHMQRPHSGGTFRSELTTQLETACALLRPGGTGICLTENASAWRAAAAMLHSHARVASVHTCLTALGPRRLERMGVVPYTASAAELDADMGRRFTQKKVSYDESFAPAGAFEWALALLFRLR